MSQPAPLHRRLRPFGIHDTVAVVVLVVLCAMQLSNFADDPGLGWHLRTGALILHDRAIPAFDPFLAFSQPRPWISDQWLSDAVFAAIFQAGSWLWLSVAATALYYVTFIFVLYRTVVRSSPSVLAASFAVLLVISLAQVHFVLRPVLFSFLFAAVLYGVLLERWRTALREVPSVLPQSVSLGCALLFALWANLHPSFVFGLVLLVLYTAALAFENVLGRFKNTGAFRHAVILTGICALATLINPYGLELHRSILRLAQSDYFMDLHTEWKSPDFKSPQGRIFQLIAAILIITGYYSRRARQAFGSFELFALIFFGAQSLCALRVLPYFAIVAAPPLAGALASLGELLPRTASMARLRSAFEWLEAREQRSYRGWVMVPCLIGVAVFASMKGSIPFYRGALGPSAHEFPYAAVEYLRGKAPSNRESVIASIQNWGGFIEFEGQGKLKPIIDDRNTLAGEEFYKSYYAAVAPDLENRDRWYDYFQSFGAEYILLPAQSHLAYAVAVSGKVPEVYRDDQSIVFEMRKTQ